MHAYIHRMKKRTVQVRFRVSFELPKARFVAPCGCPVHRYLDFG